MRQLLASAKTKEDIIHQIALFYGVKDDRIELFPKEGRIKNHYEVYVSDKLMSSYVVAGKRWRFELSI